MFKFWSSPRALTIKSCRSRSMALCMTSNVAGDVEPKAWVTERVAISYVGGDMLILARLRARVARVSAAQKVAGDVEPKACQ